MDISSISSALLSVNSSDPGSLANAVSIKMLDNAILSNESLGVGLAKMMENSVYLFSFLIFSLFYSNGFNFKHNIFRKTCHFHTASGWKW